MPHGAASEDAGSSKIGSTETIIIIVCEGGEEPQIEFIEIWSKLI